MADPVKPLTDEELADLKRAALHLNARFFANDIARLIATIEARDKMLAEADAVCEAIYCDGIGGLWDGENGKHFQEACARHRARAAKDGGRG